MRNFVVLFIFWVSTVFSAEHPVFLMPMNCGELVPDTGPFLNFFESVGRGIAPVNRMLAKRVFKVLGMREKVLSETGRQGDVNPIDPLIRKFLCYFREQKEPLRVVAYDDADFTQFVSKELSTLEKSVDAAVFQIAFEDQSRKEYERKLSTQRELVDSIRDEANREANRVFEKVLVHARSKVRR